jgi:RNA polymerase sigma-70 factor, ECF subfamily
VVAVVVLNEERNVDLDLLEQAKLGELTAFDELISRHKQSIYTLLYRFIDDEDWASELTIDTFVRAYRVLQDFPSDMQVHTWLLKTAGNIARSAINEEVPQNENDLGSQDTLQQLPEQIRMVFVLSVFVGLGYNDIAETVDCPVGIVKSRMNQARILVRDSALQSVTD